MKRAYIWVQLVLWVVLGGGWCWAGATASQQFVSARAVNSTERTCGRRSAPAPTRLAKRVVVVVLSGVGASSLNDPANPFAFPTLRRLAAEGAWGISEAVVPSGDRPTWTALLTGAPPSISGVVSEQSNRTLDNLIPVVNMPFIIGSQRALLSRGVAAGTAQVQAVASSDRVAETASASLRNNQSPLVVIMLDVARREQYSGSRLWERVDTQLRDIMQVLDPQEDCLVVTSDHGDLPDGTFGGEEPAVTQTPLVLWGAGVIPGPVGRVHQIDLAPTITLLRGTELPPLATGRPIFEALQLTAEEQARAHLAWLDLQLALHPQQGREMQPAQAAAARNAFAHARWSETVTQAEAAVQQMTSSPAASSLASSVYVWSIGLPLSLLLGARALARWGRRIARWLALPVLGLELYVLAWSLIFFVLAGHSISLSALYGSIGGQLLRIGVWAVLALSVAVLPLAWAAVGQGPGYALQQVGRLVGVLQIVGAMLAAGIVLAVKQPLAHSAAWAALLIVLAQLAGIGLVAPVVAGFTAALTDVFERGR